jgi:predicted KAP-like P-loop ATPase
MGEIIMTGLKDVPIESSQEDKLQINNYANALTKFISSTETPVTIGIQGDWGNGKTSLMNLIEELIGKKSSENRKTRQIWTLWFKAWQFSQFNMDAQLTESLLLSDISL